MKHNAFTWWLFAVGSTAACGGKTDQGIGPIAAAGGATQIVAGASGFGGSNFNTGGSTAMVAGGTFASGFGGSNASTGGIVATATDGTFASDFGGSAGTCVIRVATTGDDSNSGSDWSLALKSVQKGLDAASTLISQAFCSAVEVWVAAGTYTPTCLTNSADPRTATFRLLANVGLYGGFSGTETALIDRNVGTHVTTLTGDIGTSGDTSDNSYRVVTGVTGATLDGFTITGGFADGVPQDETDCGGGMYNRSASPTVTNCTFAKNNAGRGGGMYNYDRSSPTVTNSSFTGNSAKGMYNQKDSSPTVTNCTFSNNAGGAIYNGCYGLYCGYTSEPQLTNCILWGNTAGTSLSEIDDPIRVGENGGSWDPASPSYYSSTKVSYSIVQGGFRSGVNILNADPLLVDAANGKLAPSAGSPAIDAGNGCVSHVTLIDQAGNSRWDIANVPNTFGGIDIGAFEYRGAARTDTRITAFSCN